MKSTQRLHDSEVARTAVGSEKDESPADQRAVVTLSPPVAAATRRMSEQLGSVGPTEVVRRGLMLLDLLLSLRSNEELVVRNRDSGECERLRFAWQTF
jgi:hypothetical protein